MERELAGTPNRTHGSQHFSDLSVKNSRHAFSLPASSSRENSSGFSVVHLVVLIAILLVITAIAIPGIVRSKFSRNEAAAIGALQTLNSACVTYRDKYGGYPRALANLGPGAALNASSAALIDASLASGTTEGYVLKYLPGATDAAGNPLSYSITAVPSTPGRTGQRQFYTDQSGVIRANKGTAADVTSTPIS